MSAPVEKLKGLLEEVFGLPFQCGLIDETNSTIEVAFSNSRTADSFSVMAWQPHASMCEATLKLGNFARPLLRRWIDAPDKLADALDFAKSISSDISFIFSAFGSSSRDLDVFLSLLGDGVDYGNVTLQASWGGLNGENADEAFCLIVIACMGFGLMASGYCAEFSLDEGEFEGSRRMRTAQVIERSRVNRARCIAHYGSVCQVCGFDFAETYGAFAKGRIEVHHIKPVSEFDSAQSVDPVKDLIPLCPNCHTAIHCVTPPLDPEELKQRISQRRGGK